MNSRRFNWVFRRYGTLLAGGVLLVLPVLAQSAEKPRRVPAKPPAAPLPAVAAPVAPVPPSQPEFADAFPSPIRPTPADLLLKPEDEKKADAFALFALGLAAEQNSDQEAMLERYRKALELDPGNPELAVKVAYELARRNDPSSAIQVLKDAIKAAPKEALPYIYLSQLYAKNLNKPELAIKYAELALALAPDNFAALQAVYELYVAEGQEKKAAELLGRATKSASTSGKYWIQLAELEQGMWLKEEGSAEPAQLEKMNTAFRKAAELGKDDAVLLSKVADYYVLSKQIKAAIPVYLSILALAPDPGDPPLNNVRDKLARCFLVNDQRDEAIKQLEVIVKENPLRFETYELLGELYLQKEDYENALTSFENGLRLDNSDPASHERLGFLLLRTKRYDRAVDILQAARKAHPARPVLSYLHGIALSQVKRHEEALAAFAATQSAAETNRDDLLNAEFYFSYGAAAEQAGQVEKAVGLLQRSIELEPENAQAFNYLGYMWVERNERLEEGGDLIKKALAIEPENSAYLDSLGWYYFRKGDFDQALTELEKALAIMQREDKKEDATVLDHLGETYLKLGKVAEAVGSWEKSLALEKSKKVEEKMEAAKQKLTKANEPPAPNPEK